jgi:hypothetical protein
MTYSDEEQKNTIFVNENFIHNVILCIFERDNIFYAPMSHIILRVSQTRQKENVHYCIICKKRLADIFQFNGEFCCECWQRRTETSV